jgi:acetylornithine deacetylase/succinyl-diaminopimelate desuccinylase-like protein
MAQAALQYAQKDQKQALEELKELLRIPSISTLPDHAKDVRRAADWITQKLKAIGFENIQLLETPRHPVIYADWLNASGKPTLLIYGHYDVQPVDPVNEWETPPFEPTARGENLYARGSSDDKGQVMVHLKALEAIMKTDRKLPINVKLMIEGEEEIGSENLKGVLDKHKKLFQADACVISDSQMLTPTQPLIVVGLRGLCYTEVEVTGPSHDLHSGAYGGAVHNPMKALCEIISKLHDANNKITIPGFYDRVRALSKEEKEELAMLPFTDKTLQQETGVPKPWGEAGFTTKERIGARPTLEVHGIRGGFIGDGAKTVIPAKALAKISMRLVPNQTAEEAGRLFKKHVESLAPSTVKVNVKILHGADPALVDRKHKAIEAAARAYETTFGAKPYYLLEGGSIPVVVQLQRMFNLPVALMGFGLPDDRLHSPNEKYHLPNYYKGIECTIRYYYELAK